MKTIFLIPGLGADHRVFDFLNLSGYQRQVVSWIEPFNNESIEQYAGRLSNQISSSNPVIIGVSFGGMMAVEIGKLLQAEKIILISSARTMHEIPAYTRFIGFFGFHKLLPKAWLKSPGRLLFYLFGVKNHHEKKLLSDIVRDTDSKFLIWAIDKIVLWKNTIIPHNTVLISGSHDRLFPGALGDIIINGGGHFMIVNRANEVSEQLKRIIT